MTRLFMMMVLAAVLWPLDAENRPLGIGGEPLSAQGAAQGAARLAGMAIHEIQTFCDSRADFCQNVTETAAGLAVGFGNQLYEIDFSNTGSTQRAETQDTE